MKTLLTTFVLLTSIAISCSAQSPNVLFICVDDLRPELHSFGADYIHSPNIDHLAATGRAFHRHYVQAPTCGASRYALLTGTYGPTGNQAFFNRAKKLERKTGDVSPSMPEWFRENGYATVSVGKVSHRPGGWGGADWKDYSKFELPGAWVRQFMPCEPWKHPRGAMHGLANGEIRPGRSLTKHKMAGLQSLPGPDTIYPDGLIADEGIEQLKELAAADKPFFLAIGLIKPHLPFGSPQRYMEPYKDAKLPPIPHPEKPDWKTTWHKSGEFFDQYHYDGDPRKDPEYADEVRRHYAACVTYADKHVGDILETLKETGQIDNTIVVLWGDHGWHLGEHAVWGKHTLFEESLRSPLIVRAPGMEAPGEKSDAVVQTVDIFPTLCELAGVPKPNFAHGTSLTPQLKDPDAPGHNAYSYSGKAKTIRTPSHRMTLHPNGSIELYDHRSPEKETSNIADQNSAQCEQLKELIIEKEKMQQSSL